jgi:hypothetical protein
MSSPRGLTVGGIGGMRATGGAVAEALEGDSDDGGVVDIGGVPLRRTDGGVMCRNGKYESSERILRGGLRMLRCMFKLRSERLACGTYLDRRLACVGRNYGSRSRGDFEREIMRVGAKRPSHRDTIHQERRHNGTHLRSMTIPLSRTKPRVENEVKRAESSLQGRSTP